MMNPQRGNLGARYFAYLAARRMKAAAKVVLMPLGCLYRWLHGGCAPLDSSDSRILVVQLQYLGDSLQFAPVLSYLLDHDWSDRKVEMLANAQSGQIYRRESRLQALHVDPGWRMGRGGFNYLRSLVFAWRLRGRYDVVVFDSNHVAVRYSLLGLVLGAPKTYGFAVRNNLLGLFLRRVVPVSEETFSTKSHRTLGVLLASHLVGCNEGEITLAPYRLMDAEDLLPDGLMPGTYLVIHPFSRLQMDSWGLENFAEAARSVRERWPDIPIVLTGSEEDRMQRSPPLEALIATGEILDLRGRTDFDGLAALVTGARAMLTVDTGPMHVAAIAQVPVLTIRSGKTLAAKWTYDYPSYRFIQHQPECYPCGLTVCNRNLECIRGITVDEVLAAMGALLDSTAAQRAQS